MPKKPTTTPTTTTGAKNTGAKKTKGGRQKQTNALFEKRPKNFGIGQSIRPKVDLSRFVRWPRYVKLQRQRRILMSRLKVPPTVNQFTKVLDRASAIQLFKVMAKYRPESRLQKKQRLLKAAEAKTKGDKDTASQATTPKSTHLHFGISEITSLVEKKEAKLVAIAHDVDPIELVVWLPTLCRKMGVPYCIVKGKARLGAAVHQKTATCVALTSVEKEDLKDFNGLVDLCNQSFNNNTDLRKQWGGGKLGSKAAATQKKRERAVAKEQAAKMSA